MGKLPAITGEQLLKALLRNGFEISRQRGSHVQIRKYVDGEKVSFPVPVHKGKTLKPGTLRGILRKADVTVDELNEQI